jgi:aminoglycoside phosphotransferase (APT) family kinase protein
MWSTLSRPDIDAEDSACSDARRRILGRLGAYAELIVRPLNLRPTAATLLYEDDQRIEVRVSTPRSHVVLAIAPDGDLAAEIAWLRALAPANLPIPRLIASDLSCTLVPFTYAIESFVGGWPLDRLPADARMRVAARQVGRTLRRAHQIPASGFGRPTTTGRWPARTWRDALYGWLDRHETRARAEELLGAETTLLVLDATVDHPALACEQPWSIHGAVEPARAIVTVGETVQLEALARPGELVGGDPMFDLAHGLLPRHPAPFRQGLLESYTAAGPLAPAQEERLRRLGLLLLVADTLWRAEPAALARLPDEVADGLRELHDL